MTKEKEKKEKHNPKLRWKKAAGGMESAFLEFYLGCVDGKPVQKKAFLGIKRFAQPTKSWQKSENVKAEGQAEALRAIEEAKFKNNRDGYEMPVFGGPVNFLAFMDGYIKNYKKKDVGGMKAVRRQFLMFLELKEGHEAKVLTAFQVTEQLVREFAAYLRERCQGEGAKTYFTRFKKMLRAAEAENVLRVDPSRSIVTKELRLVDPATVHRKEVLEAAEYEMLLATPAPEGVRPDVVAAFTLCLFTGMRFCDVKALTYGNVNYKEKKLSFKQLKTGNVAEPPLDDNLIALIGGPEGKSPEALVFDLPSRCTCGAQLSEWVKAAGITKHITWHCARHSLGTMLAADENIPLVDVASILGHSSVKMTERYVKVSDKEKKKALAVMPTRLVATKMKEDGK